MSGTTISGARPLPLITEQSWISAQAEYPTAALTDNLLSICMLAFDRAIYDSACLVFVSLHCIDNQLFYPEVSPDNLL